MSSLLLTPQARARLWPEPGPARFPPIGELCGALATTVAPTEAWSAGVVLEAYVPRGARAEYGLLGLAWEREEAGLKIVVPYSSADGAPLPDALAHGADDVRVGLPVEYAAAVLDALIAAGPHPAGRIRVCAAAHGHVGSSSRFFARLATAAVALMRLGTDDPVSATETVRRILV